MFSTYGRIVLLSDALWNNARTKFQLTFPKHLNVPITKALIIRDKKQLSMPVSELELFNAAVATYDFDMTVENDAPRVQLLSVAHDDRVSLIDCCEHHRGAQTTARCHRHVAECLQ